MMLRFKGLGVLCSRSDIEYSGEAVIEGTQPRKRNLASDLRAMMESEEGADVTLVAGGKQLLAHSQILAARSPVFAAMFRSNMRDAVTHRVEITDVEEGTLWDMLWFMYTDEELESIPSELLAAAEKYDLPLLKKLCELNMVEDLSVICGETVMQGLHSEKGSLASDLGALLESGEGADVTFLVGGSQLPVHSQILAARSPVFAAMFRSSMRESITRRVEISDMQEDALRQMLWFMYTDTVPELESVAAELLAAADKYDLPLLKDLCELQMARDLSVETAASTAAVAIVYRCLALKSAAVRFVADHLDVLATAGWQQLLRDYTEAAVEICSEMAAAAPRTPRPGTKVEEAGSDTGAPKSRSLSELEGYPCELIDAAKRGDVKQLRALVAAGANLIHKVPIDTPLHYAAKGGHVEATAFLVQSGMDLEAKDSDGFTPLSLATQMGHVAVVQLLLMASADPNNGSRYGWTPLHWAVWHYNVEVAEVLLDAGADRAARDHVQKTPLDVARRNNYQQLIKMLS